MEQLDMFDILNEKYVIDKNKPTHLIELFSGYGSQRLAYKYLLNKDVDRSTIVEWAWKSIQAYKDIHCPNDNTDYSLNLTDDDVINRLSDYGVSNDYNKPMTTNEIKRKGIKWCREVYNNIKATNNLVDISRVKGCDLEISDKETTILTYSFPCQDLSLR